MSTRVIAYVDKTVVKIRGVKVHGLKPVAVERALARRLGRPVRVIGVTGDSIDMDVYGLDAEAVWRNERGIIKAVSAVDGICGAEVARIASADKPTEMDIARIPAQRGAGCARERWASPADERKHHTHRR